MTAPTEQEVEAMAQRIAQWSDFNRAEAAALLRRLWAECERLNESECDKVMAMSDEQVRALSAVQGSSADIDALTAKNAVTRAMMRFYRTRAERAEAEVALLREVVAAADAMRDMGVSIGQQVVHPEGMPDDRALLEFIGLFDGPFQRDYDAARGALLKEGK